MASRWRLRSDGAAWSGFNSAVWPVTTADGEPLALKVSVPHPGAEAEPLALRAWAGKGAVRLYEHDKVDRAMLLQRLNGDHTLQDLPEIDEACTVIGTILATLDAAPVPPEVPKLEAEVQRITESIDSNRATHPFVLTASVAGGALATLRELVQDLRARAQRGLVHGDGHFLNVLHTLPGHAPQ